MSIPVRLAHYVSKVWRGCAYRPALSDKSGSASLDDKLDNAVNRDHPSGIPIRQNQYPEVAGSLTTDR